MIGCLYIFLDYDGTLVPIRGTPGKARLPGATRRLLADLAGLPFVRLAIVTGRSLRRIKAMVGVREITYAGNHGLEIEGPGIPRRTMAGENCRRIMAAVGRSLRRDLSSVKGILIENKGLALSLHFRLVDRKSLPAVQAAFTKATAPYVAAKKVAVSAGKKVLEVTPAGAWDKGRAALWLMRKLGMPPGRTFAVYIGDDTADESAFAALAKRGLTIKVGLLGKTKARYRLKNPAQVIEFLNVIKGICCARQ